MENNLNKKRKPNIIKEVIKEEILNKGRHYEKKRKIEKKGEFHAGCCCHDDLSNSH